MIHSSRLSIAKQHGSALVVSLSILLVLTILGVSTMQTTSLEEKMAGNARDSQVAFEAAEAAIRNAENFINSLNDLAHFAANGVSQVDASTGYFLPKSDAAYNVLYGNTEAWKIEANWNNASRTVSNADYSTGQVALAPKVMIQMVDANVATDESAELLTNYSGPQLRFIQIFQITARGSGISPNSRAMIQTYYGRAFPLI